MLWFPKDDLSHPLPPARLLTVTANRSHSLAPYPLSLALTAFVWPTKITLAIFLILFDYI